MTDEMGFCKNKYWIWLASIPFMWRKKAKASLDVFGEPEGIYMADEKSLKQSGIFSDKEIKIIQDGKKIFDYEKEYEKLKRQKIQFVTLDDSKYPKKLNVYEDRPLWLFYKGKLPDNEERMVGIVGARYCSRYGNSMAKNIAGSLKKYGISVVSGMAKGVDMAAHMGAVDSGGMTYGILGNGVDICYPREAIGIYMDMEKYGGIISEYYPGTKPFQWQFPERNRIISMLSDALVVVEARKKSGTLITTDYALSYGKSVFAVPGRVGDELSEGCNELIKSGASLFSETDDILYDLGVYKDSKMGAGVMDEKNKNEILLEKENEVVYSVLDLLPQSIEVIVEKTRMTPQEVFGVIMKLMMEGLVIEPVKNHYAKK